MPRPLRYALLCALCACQNRVPREPGAPLPQPPPPTGVTRVPTCSELALESVRAAAGAVIPGAVLEVRGRGLATVSQLTVGGARAVTTHEGDALRVEVPPLLAAGLQLVEARVGRCLASTTVTVGRAVAVARRGSGALELLDSDTLATIDTIDSGFASVEQLQWSMDGRALVVRSAAGEVALVSVGARRAGAAVRGAGPFVLAQASTRAFDGLLAFSGALYRVQSERATLTRVEGEGSDALSVATPLDGFRALVLERSGAVLALEHPFANPSTAAPIEHAALAQNAVRSTQRQQLRAPRELALAEGGVVAPGHGPLGAAFDGTDPPALVPMNSLTGALGSRLEVPGALGNVQFVSGDVLILDSRLPELLVADITALGGQITRLALRDEATAGVVRTVVARSQYLVGALVLRAGDGGVPEASVLHVLDAHYEPPRELASQPSPGARGLAGVPGAGHPFVLWSASALTRVTTQPAGEPVRRALAAGEREFARVAVQP